MKVICKIIADNNKIYMFMGSKFVKQKVYITIIHCSSNCNKIIRILDSQYMLFIIKTIDLIQMEIKDLLSSR